MRWLVALLAVVMSGCVATRPYAQSASVVSPAPAGVVTGVVMIGGSPLPGATVWLQPSRGGKHTVLTNEHGVWTFRDVPAGKVEVGITAAALVPVREVVEITETSGVKLVTAMKVEVAETVTVTATSPRFVLASTGRVSIEEAPPVDATRGNVATFSIDVDRASYANVRGFLARNVLPPAKLVRIEELINYFTYSDPQPQGSAPLSVTTEVASCPWHPSLRLLRVGIQGRNLEAWKMAANNLVFLIDVSESMEPESRLPLIRAALRLLVDKLRAEDRVAIVVYAGAAGLVLPSTSGADKTTILAALDRLQTGGSTAGGEGLALAYAVAQEHFLPNGNNRVILATDGDFNVGISTIEEIEQFIEEKRKSGVHLTAIGVGENNFRDDILETLADRGDGHYAYLDGLAEAKRVFERELTGTLVTIAKDVKVQLDFDPDVVASYRQVGYENRALTNADFDDETKDAGDLGAGHSVTALFELELVPRARSREVAKLRLRYRDPASGRSGRLDAAAIDDGRSIWQASRDMQFASAVAAYGMLLRNTSLRGGYITYADVAQLARAGSVQDVDGTREEFLRMIDTTRLLSGEAPASIAKR